MNGVAPQGVVEQVHDYGPGNTLRNGDEFGHYRPLDDNPTSSWISEALPV